VYEYVYPSLSLMFYIELLMGQVQALAVINML
jgi:hypothetical protein